VKFNCTTILQFGQHIVGNGVEWVEEEELYLKCFIMEQTNI